MLIFKTFIFNFKNADSDFTNVATSYMFSFYYVFKGMGHEKEFKNFDKKIYTSRSK
jgi:hypothetical protein